MGSDDRLASTVRDRLITGGAADRWRHVESVARTVRKLAVDSGWPAHRVDAAERAAWYHDALKLEAADVLRGRIEAAGEKPDPWILERATNLLHAHAAAVWASDRWGESDPAVLEAVRHHPTGHPEWSDLGSFLYVADFCEPGRVYANSVGASDLVALASAGRTGLREAARQIIDHRTRWIQDRGREVHPLTVAWRRKLEEDR